MYKFWCTSICSDLFTTCNWTSLASQAGFIFDSVCKGVFFDFFFFYYFLAGVRHCLRIPFNSSCHHPCLQKLVLCPKYCTLELHRWEFIRDGRHEQTTVVTAAKTGLRLGSLISFLLPYLKEASWPLTCGQLHVRYSSVTILHVVHSTRLFV